MIQLYISIKEVSDEIRSICIFVAVFTSNIATAGQKFERADVTLDFNVSGSGPIMYLLHGGMESRDSFKAQVEALEEHFTVVALDSREQGRSSPSPTPISYQIMANDVLALSRHLGHQRFSIMGQSDGGITALTLALQQPEIVNKLILIGTNYHFNAYPLETRNFLRSYEWDGSSNPQQFPGMFIKHYLLGQDDLSKFGTLLKKWR